MASEKPSPPARKEVKIFVGVLILAAVLLAVFLMWGPELRMVQGAGEPGIEAPTEIYSAPAEGEPAQPQ